jgi:glycosyltransferase involved in cell wall biosynthesis
MRLLYSLLAFLFVLQTTFADDSKKTLAIFTYEDSRQSYWDKTSLLSGVTGSEEAIIYMADELAALGYQVTIFANPAPDSPLTDSKFNPRYVNVKYDDETIYDVGIVWRQPYAGHEFKKKAKEVYLWPHDTHHWEVSKESAEVFKDVLWLTNWQREQWLTVAPAFEKFKNIYGNGIWPEFYFPLNKKENPYSCIYASNYSRGLEVLLDCWPTVKSLFPKATLDIYYGWQNWGMLSAEKEAKMRAQVDSLQTLDVKEHGMVGHPELHKAFSKASFWTYPCIAQETFCITALKAQYSGAIPVIIEGSGLTETCPFGYKSHQVKDYLSNLIIAMLDSETIKDETRAEMRSFIDEKYTWKKIAEKWHETFSKKD